MQPVAHQWAGHDKAGVAFDLGGVGHIKVDAVPVPERGVVKHLLHFVAVVLPLGNRHADGWRRAHRRILVVFSETTSSSSSPRTSINTS